MEIFILLGLVASVAYLSFQADRLYGDGVVLETQAKETTVQQLTRAICSGIS